MVREYSCLIKLYLNIGKLYAVKAILKGRVNDMRVLTNEVNILRELVSGLLY